MISFRIKKTLLSSSFSASFPYEPSLSTACVWPKGASLSDSLKAYVLGCQAQSQAGIWDCPEGLVHHLMWAGAHYLLLIAEIGNAGHTPPTTSLQWMKKQQKHLLCLFITCRGGKGRLNLSEFTVQQRSYTCPGLCSAGNCDTCWNLCVCNFMHSFRQASSYLPVLCWTGMDQAKLLFGRSFANCQRVLLHLASSFDYKNNYKQLWK